MEMGPFPFILPPQKRVTYEQNADETQNQFVANTKLLLSSLWENNYDLPSNCKKALHLLCISSFVVLRGYFYCMQKSCLVIYRLGTLLWHGSWICAAVKVDRLHGCCLCKWTFNMHSLLSLGRHISPQTPVNRKVFLWWGDACFFNKVISLP